MYLFSLLANIVILATAPLCTTQGTYTANRIILGFFGSPVESLCEVSIVDIWFVHERPKYLAWYGWSLSLTGKLAPMISGFINYGMGWEWTLWWCAIFNAVAFVYCFLFMEETNYDRIPDKAAMRGSAPASQSPHTAIPEASATFQKSKSKHSSRVPPEACETGEVLWPRKSYLDKLGIKDKKRPNRLLDIAIAPFKGFTYPAVVYAGYVSKTPLFPSGVLTCPPNLVKTYVRRE